MRKSLFPFFSILALTSSLQAETFMGPTSLSDQNIKDINIMGPANLKKVTGEKLHVMGPLAFKEIKISGSANVQGPVTDGEKGEFESLTVLGPLKGEEIKAKQISVKGLVNVKELKVDGSTDIVGVLKGKKIESGSMEITGPVKVEKLKVNGETTIVGPLEADESEFKNIVITTDEAKLKASKADSILIKRNDSNLVVSGTEVSSDAVSVKVADGKSTIEVGKNNASQKEQILTLKDKTVINGDITFESGKGKVFVDEDVLIKGKVNGGEVIKKK